VKGQGVNSKEAERHIFEEVVEFNDLISTTKIEERISGTPKRKTRVDSLRGCKNMELTNMKKVRKNIMDEWSTPPRQNQSEETKKKITPRKKTPAIAGNNQKETMPAKKVQSQLTKDRPGSTEPQSKLKKTKQKSRNGNRIGKTDQKREKRKKRIRGSQTAQKKNVHRKYYLKHRKSYAQENRRPGTIRARKNGEILFHKKQGGSTTSSASERPQKKKKALSARPKGRGETMKGRSSSLAK